jgi:hypothetical protein
MPHRAMRKAPVIPDASPPGIVGDSHAVARLALKPPAERGIRGTRARVAGDHNRLRERSTGRFLAGSDASGPRSSGIESA